MKKLATPITLVVLSLFALGCSGGSDTSQMDNDEPGMMDSEMQAADSGGQMSGEMGDEMGGGEMGAQMEDEGMPDEMMPDSMMPDTAGGMSGDMSGTH